MILLMRSMHISLNTNSHFCCWIPINTTWVCQGSLCTIGFPSKLKLASISALVSTFALGGPIFVHFISWILAYGVYLMHIIHKIFNKTIFFTVIFFPVIFFPTIFFHIIFFHKSLFVKPACLTAEMSLLKVTDLLNASARLPHSSL